MSEGSSFRRQGWWRGLLGWVRSTPNPVSHPVGSEEAPPALPEPPIPRSTPSVPVRSRPPDLAARPANGSSPDPPLAVWSTPWSSASQRFDGLDAHRVPRVSVAETLVTRGEREFLKALIVVCSGRANIFTQVAVNRLVQLPEDDPTDELVNLWRRFINPRSVDFVLTDRLGLKPLVAIELDDASHRQSHRKRRDELIGALFDAAGLPLLRIRAASAYDTRVLLRQLEPYLPPAQPGSPPPPAPQPAATRPAAAQPAPPPRPPSPPKA